MRRRSAHPIARPLALALCCSALGAAAPARDLHADALVPDLDARADLRDRPAPTFAPSPVAPAPDRDPAPLNLAAPAPRDQWRDPLDTPAALDRLLAGDLAIAQALRLEYDGVGLDPSRPDALGRGSLSLNRPPGAADAAQQRLGLVDVALSWDAMAPQRDLPLTISLLGGVRAVHYAARGADAPGDQEGTILFDPANDSGLAAAPLAGVRLRWDLPGGVFVRTGTAWGVRGEPDPGDLNLSADLGYEVSRRLDFSVGYERTRAAMGSGAFEAAIRQDFVFARLSLRF